MIVYLDGYGRCSCMSSYLSPHWALEGQEGRTALIGQ